MSIFVNATPAPVFKSKFIGVAATFYAAILVIAAVAQLFKFEEFIVLTEGFHLPGGDVTAHLFAALIIVLEVFALPFFLRMRLSPAFRWVSMVCGWLAPAVWLLVVVWLVF